MGWAVQLCFLLCKNSTQGQYCRVIKKDCPVELKTIGTGICYGDAGTYFWLISVYWSVSLFFIGIDLYHTCTISLIRNSVSFMHDFIHLFRTRFKDQEGQEHAKLFLKSNHSSYLFMYFSLFCFVGMNFVLMERRLSVMAWQLSLRHQNQNQKSCKIIIRILLIPVTEIQQIEIALLMYSDGLVVKDLIPRKSCVPLESHYLLNIWRYFSQ